MTHHYPNLGSDASSVWNFCARPCDTEVPITLTRNFVSQFCNFRVGKTKNFEGRRLACVGRFQFPNLKEHERREPGGVLWEFLGGDVPLAPWNP